jgi:mannan endo-1,4-beta-mannosidase
MIKKAPVFFIIAIFILISCTAQPQSDHFVKVRGIQFTIGEKPYYFVGTNLWYGANLGAQTEGGNRERLIRELDLLQSLGINNLRVLGASEGDTQHNTVNPPIQPQPGEYDEQVLKGLDFLLDEMAKRGMYAVVYLNNYWVWSGGMSQYMAWLDNVPVPNPFLPPFDWGKFMNFSATFYSSDAGNQLYHQYLDRLINRKNTINGKVYKNDPTIMSWQLANEPRPGRGEEGKKNFPVFSQWIDETAKYIKSLDRNHLVSTGNEGLKGSMESAELYKEINQYNSIDYLTFHLWLLNWSWFDPLKPEETYPTAEVNAIEYIDQHINFANKIGKPTVIEEFGIPRDGHSYSPDAPTTWRDKYFETVFNHIYENASNSGSMAGSNFWAWGGYGKVRDPEKAEWEKGDDFTGDPPQEPQGRNSVFASDSTTLSVLSKFADLMNSL